MRLRSHDEPDVFHTTTVGAVIRPASGDDAPSGATVRTSDPLVDVLAHQADDEVDDVSVVDEAGKLVGVCTRHDLLTTRLALLDHERPEPGWLAGAARLRPRARVTASATGSADPLAMPETPEVGR